jgi:NTE family protein
VGIGIVLSGGGAKGDFELGALRAIYNRGIRPTVLTGTSVGAILAAKLAENATTDAALSELEAIWYGFTGDYDMYIPDPVVAAAPSRILEGLKLSGVAIGADVVLGAGLPGPIGQVSILLGLGLGITDIIAFWSTLANGSVQSLFRLDPIQAKLQTQLSPEAVSTSGIKLRLATVALEAGTLFFVNENAMLCSVDTEGHVTPTSTQVNLRDAVRASASIPGIFPPVPLASDYFVDGGIRDVLPVQAALDAGADQVLAIVAAPSGVDPPTELNPTDSGTPQPITSFEKAPIWDILYRALTQIMPDQIQQDDVGSAVKDNATIIQPEINVNDSFTIDPGLIRIAAGYGYMKAAECLDCAPVDLGTLLRFLMLCENSKGITSLRKQIWQREYAAAGQRTAYEDVKDTHVVPVPDPGAFLELRQLKTQVLNLVEQRIQLFGAHPVIMVSGHEIDFGDVGINSTLSNSLVITNIGDGGVPADVSDWWLQFEKHPWYNPAADNPWGLFISSAGTVPAATPPQLTVTTSPLHITSVSSSAPTFIGTVASNTVDALASTTLVVMFSPTAVGPVEGTITISSDDPNTPAIEIAVTGQGVDIPPSLVVKPPIVDFGPVPNNGKRTRIVVIRNPGSTVLPIKAPIITGISGGLNKAFSAEWTTPRTLGAYSTNTMEVTFSPAGAGTYQGRLSISSEMASIIPAEIGLVGQCSNA